MSNDKPESLEPGQPKAGDSSTSEPQGAERRTEARYPTRDEAALEILPGPNPALSGTVLDVSRSGLRIAVPIEVERGRQLKITLQRNVIFGEVRYCRAVAGGFEAGILIQNVAPAGDRLAAHLAEDQLSLYAIGKGLTVAEVIPLREHLLGCKSCRTRLAKLEATLNPVKQPPARNVRR